MKHTITENTKPKVEELFRKALTRDLIKLDQETLDEIVSSKEEMLKIAREAVRNFNKALVEVRNLKAEEEQMTKEEKDEIRHEIRTNKIEENLKQGAWLAKDYIVLPWASYWALSLMWFMDESSPVIFYWAFLLLAYAHNAHVKHKKAKTAKQIVYSLDLEFKQ